MSKRDAPKTPPAVLVTGLRKSYKLGKTQLKVLRGVDFSVRSGEFVCIVGASGSGKSTLLHMIGLIDKPDEGSVHLDGVDVTALGSGSRNRVRSRDVGFVFQFYHLMPELNVLENVLLASQVEHSTFGWLGGQAGASRQRARDLLDRMGLAERMRHRPRELSGGERQRVAIARALMNAPKLLLADEPTGNLDSKTGKGIMDTLAEFNQAGQTIIMVTHDDRLATQASRTMELRDGRLVR